ncbi:MAG: hypothetical protein BWY43_00283 [candidate division WS2 bacterium ADurb.Bin280]|uniref:Uncharacterized protein n=1 Tax=candidate division WS2 bacterium ADurb.Bin280 TaxID=1852829 RepID=A0A1V5SFV5_9BACT|nr:MAG: hypothetical protein BWY43_00283 [candidate division WS2 bacterium ADurb.Bin280]
MHEIALATRVMMALSGLMGLSMFVLANFLLKKQKGWRLATALMQISVNAFVFVSWLGGFLQSTPGTIHQAVTFVGFVVPTVMATVTTLRVVLPEIRQRTRAH